jgi:hypothetical protein
VLHIRATRAAAIDGCVHGAQIATADPRPRALERTREHDPLDKPVG